MNYTPLRYPGGKAKIYSQICDIISLNYDEPPVYCEPFAGGFGLGMKLLLKSKVSKVYLNDLDYSIYSFWYSVLHNTEEFIAMIDQTEITINEWYNQKAIYLSTTDKYSILQKGFATFFLNRSNRSGIMKAGPIGGYSQSGSYGLDCRFNKATLKTTILNLAKRKDDIIISNFDCKTFLLRIDNDIDNIFFFLDPPYVVKGKELYKNSFTKEDHCALGKIVTNLKSKWYMTYDDTPLIRDIYKDFEIRTYDISYTVQTKKRASELLICSKNLKI